MCNPLFCRQGQILIVSIAGGKVRGGGDDTALPIDDFVTRFKLDLTEIGKVTHGPAEVRFFVGKEEVAPPPGYSHFT